MNWQPAFSLMILCALLAACSAAPPQQQSMGDYIREQKSAARELQQDGRLADALNLWRSLLPLGPADEETATAIAGLEAEIDQRVASNLGKARRASSQGRPAEADVYLLRVLALRPGHEQALQQLGDSYSARARQQQADKSSQEYRVLEQQTEQQKDVHQRAPQSTEQRLRALYAANDYAGVLALAETSNYKPDAELSGLLRSAHVALADQAEQSGQLDASLVHMQSAMSLQPIADDPLLSRSVSIRKDLSRQWYQRGTKLMKSDLPKSIAALQKSLQYNPYNDAAKRKLLQAETLQRNLERIEKGAS